MMRLQMAGTDGIIPAYAGNTSHRRRIGCIPRDHPRVCGEHSDSELYLSTSLGSSPRMRGTHVGHDHVGAVRGIIPAYAGNTDDMPLHCDELTDHPRVCGEHLYIQHADWDDPGSSPRMRGTLRWWFVVFFCPGIIPAYAGNTRLADRARCG